MLSNRHKYRLVVRGSVDRRDLVESCGKSGRNVGSELTVLSRLVHALEESEDRRVRRSGLGK